MVVDFFLCNCFSACSFDNRALDRNTNWHLANCVLCSKSKFGRLSLMKLHLSFNRNRRQTIIINESRLCVSYSKYAVTFTYRPFNTKRYFSRTRRFFSVLKTINRMNKMASIGPKFDGVTHMKFCFDIKRYLALFSTYHSPNKHTAIIGASIAHNFVSTLTL
ncbi:unknown [Cryptobacterium sp. CAG:338]|nr:unknown [Cryptobacterium sp. CAG:338]